MGDEGFSEAVAVQGSNRCLQRSFSELPKSSCVGKVTATKRRNSASKVETSSVSTSATASASALDVDVKVFQQVRISLEKLPTKQLSTLIGSPTTFDDDVTVGGKRQKVVDAEDQDDGVKKLKLESDPKEPVVRSNLNQVRLQQT